jgi:hypothetical protein
MKRISLLAGAILLTAASAAHAQNTSVVKVAKVTFNETKPEKAFLKPITVRVNASTTHGVSGVQVRLFPGRTLQDVKKMKLAVTTTGCFILKSRVDSYAPSTRTPDVSITNVDSDDFRCGANGIPQPTPFVVVVESIDVGDSSLFRIHPSQMDAYFAHAGEFILQPPPDLRCGTPVKHSSAAAKRPPAATAAPEALPAKAMVDIEVAKQHCVETVQ